MLAPTSSGRISSSESPADLFDTSELILLTNVYTTDPFAVNALSFFTHNNYLSDNEAYPVSDNKQTTERNKRVAIEILSKRLAETIYNRLTDDF